MMMKDGMMMNNMMPSMMMKDGMMMNGMNCMMNPMMMPSMMKDNMMMNCMPNMMMNGMMNPMMNCMPGMMMNGMMNPMMMMGGMNSMMNPMMMNGMMMNPMMSGMMNMMPSMMMKDGMMNMMNMMGGDMMSSASTKDSGMMGKDAGVMKGEMKDCNMSMKDEAFATMPKSGMMSAQMMEMINNMMAGMTKGDQSCMDCMCEDVVFECYGPEQRPCTGVRKGKKGVAEYMKTMSSMKCESMPDEFVEGCDAMTVMGHEKGSTKSGKSYTMPFVQVWKFKDGKVACMKEFCDPMSYTMATKA